MPQDETIAGAEGNAAAQIYTTIIESADDTPFDTEMTPEMIENHKYYNDDILQIAEEIELKLKEIDILQQSLVNARLSIEKVEAATERPISRSSPLAWAPGQIEAQIGAAEQRILQLEDKIEDEIDQVRNEYRRLAENLNSRAEMYRGDYEGLRRFQDAELLQAWQQQQHLTENGVATETAQSLSQPRTEDGYYSFHVDAYAVSWGDYRLLQEGFAITTTREALMSIVWGAAELIALEIITAGLITAASGAFMATRLASKLGRAATRVSDRALSLLIERYNKIPQRVRNKLDEIFDRVKHGDERPSRSDGTGGRGSASHLDDLPCSATACAVR